MRLNTRFLGKTRPAVKDEKPGGRVPVMLSGEDCVLIFQGSGQHFLVAMPIRIYDAFGLVDLDKAHRVGWRLRPTVKNKISLGSRLAVKDMIELRPRLADGSPSRNCARGRN
jgi:hypothetical protein